MYVRVCVCVSVSVYCLKDGLNRIRSVWDSTSSGQQVVDSVLKTAHGFALSSRTVLITGGTAGLGVETALALARAGMHVIITARSKDKAQNVVQHIIKQSGNNKVFRDI